MLNVGVIADTHGLLRPQALTALAGSDLILHLGDVGPKELLARLRDLAPVDAVRGNVDREAWTEELPLHRRLALESLELVLHHGHLPLPAGVLDGAQVVVRGHSHRPVVDRRDGVLHVNPGSAGPRRFKLPVTLVRLKIDGAEAHAELVDLLDEG
ncbi:MAG: metallophosphoesterase family protein [Trueperaceae bacterium]